MHCPKCGAESSVVETREIGGNNRRRRHCDNPSCFHRFTTLETVVQSNTKHRDVVTITIPKSKAQELRTALALLDRGLARELSQGRNESPGTELPGAAAGNDLGIAESKP